MMMYTVTWHRYPHAIEGEEMTSNSRDFDNLEKRNTIIRSIYWAGGYVEDESGNWLYEITDYGDVYDNRDKYVTEEVTEIKTEEQTTEEPEKESTDEMAEGAEIKNRLTVLNEIPTTEIFAIKYAPIHFNKPLITTFIDTASLKLKFIKEVIPRPPNTKKSP